MPTRPPSPTIRTQLLLPLRFADGYATTARVFSFDGLIDGREHLAFGLGGYAAAPTPNHSMPNTPMPKTPMPKTPTPKGITPNERILDGSQPNGATPNGATPNGAMPNGSVPLVRPHSECLTGDVLGSQRCDCGPQLREAVERIAEAGGFLLYLRQEGRGIGLYAKLDAYALQDTGLDTYQANLALGYAEDQRDYTVAAQMLQALGVARVALLSNNPDKAEQLGRLGVTVTERVPTGLHLSAANASYLAAKARRGGHRLDATPASTMISDIPRPNGLRRSSLLRTAPLTAILSALRGNHDN